MGGGMCRLCAGNADSRSGFSSDLPTLGIPGNPFMNLLLVRTSLCGGGVGSVKKKKSYFFCLVELWESFNILDLLKDFLLKLATASSFF